MKIFNLTDVETPALKQRHMVNQSLVVHGKPIEPGASVDFPLPEDRPIVARAVQHLLKAGAVAVDKLPDAYVKAKAAVASANKTTASSPTAGVKTITTPAPSPATTPAAPPAPVSDPTAPTATTPAAPAASPGSTPPPATVAEAKGRIITSEDEPRKTQDVTKSAPSPKKG